MTAYAAVYDKYGILKAVKAHSLTKDVPHEFIFDNLLETDDVQVFVWNSDMIPEMSKVQTLKKEENNNEI